MPPQPSPRPSVFSLLAMDALSVSVQRGGTVEARHRVHAVAVRDGEVAGRGRSRARLSLPVERRSRSRPCCSPAPVPTSATGRSRSRALHTEPSLRRSTPCAACSQKLPPPRTTSSAASKRADRRARSTTTAPGSTRASSPSAGPRLGDGGLPARRAPAAAGARWRSRSGRRACRRRNPDRYRRLRRGDVRACRSSAWRPRSPASPRDDGADRSSQPCARDPSS